MNTFIFEVPRVLFDGWTSSDFGLLFSSEKEIEEMTNTIISVIVNYHMDGIVLEIWSQMPPKKSKYSIELINYCPLLLFSLWVIKKL